MDSEYNFELDKVVKAIKKEKAKIVLLQFPDGLKKQATKTASEIESKTKVTCLIWLGSCFGACDLPPVQHMKQIDLVIQFGHTPWKFKDKNLKVLKLKSKKPYGFLGC